MQGDKVSFSGAKLIRESGHSINHSCEKDVYADYAHGLDIVLQGFYLNEGDVRENIFSECRA